MIHWDTKYCSDFQVGCLKFKSILNRLFSFSQLRNYEGAIIIIFCLLAFLATSDGWVIAKISQAHYQQCRILWTITVLTG